MPKPLPVQIDEARQAARKRSIKRKLLGLEIPMPREVKLGGEIPNMVGAIQTDGTTIHSQGRPDRRTMAHEVAHLLDSQVMTDADRQRFATIMGKPDKPWDVVETVGDGQRMVGHSSMSEQFADMFAMLATKQYPRAGFMESGYLDSENMPSKRKLLRLGRSLERMKARYGLGDYVRPR